MHDVFLIVFLLDYCHLKKNGDDKVIFEIAVSCHCELPLQKMLFQVSPKRFLVPQYKGSHIYVVAVELYIIQLWGKLVCYYSRA